MARAAGADRHLSIAAESGELVLAALDAGAVDFVQKPTALATEKLLEIADELIEKVKAAAAVARGASRPRHCRRPARPPRHWRAKRAVVMMWSSSASRPADRRR